MVFWKRFLEKRKAERERREREDFDAWVALMTCNDFHHISTTYRDVYVSPESKPTCRIIDITR